ncbi:hypothetical protein ACCS88_11095, partial [Rhizobium ruizarguesonis]
QNQPWREPIHPSSPPQKHYRQKNPIRKTKTPRKIDGFVSGLMAGHLPGHFAFFGSFCGACRSAPKAICLIERNPQPDS